MVQIAIMGFGVVGSGVAEIFDKNSTLIEKRLQELVEVKYILDLRDFPQSPFGSRVIHDFSLIEQDPEVEIVVETIGGTGAALEYTKRALRSGKSVVTSNKELVAKHGFTLMALAAENNVSYLYEASVGGGIPIIHPLKQCLAANEITGICGILNGTTNYILTRMSHSQLSMSEALREAQANGYAEADPTADVEGLDACRKICILAALAFGHQIDPDRVYTEGIKAVSVLDMAYAKTHGWRIRLLGRAFRLPEGKLQVLVAPHFVKAEAPLGGVEDVYNAIAVHGNAVGDVLFYGRGAGKLPTASAVAADVMLSIQNRSKPQYPDWDREDVGLLAPIETMKSRWYIRVKGEGDTLANAFAPCRLLSVTALASGETAALTAEAMTLGELRERLNGFPIQMAIRLLED